ncbi:MAG TPA: ABC transporter substrate-binding protein [Acidimicrobiales bacterium]|nr:ABC transporter substrate-binding protein [Acidimicrobiales bacterium]
MARGGPALRAWRRMRRRSPLVQAATALVVLAVVGAVVYAVSSSKPAPATGGISPVRLTPSGVGVDEASNSARGVTAGSINVAFPVSNLASLSSSLGFAGDAEFSAQTKAIHVFVNAVNADGGIDGRKIDPIIADFDPTNEAGMRALCKQWTEGSPPVFAVLDGVGAWNGDDELCITQEGHTPFIGAWTTVTEYAAAGAPYLWWLGPDQADILATLVSWGTTSGLLGAPRKVAIVAGDDQSDQIALDDYLLPDLTAAGLPTPMIETIPTNPDDTAALNSATPIIVQKLKAAGVQSVIPLMPFNSLFAYLGQESAQNYYPKLLLSDYQSSITASLGLIPFPFEDALNGQEGITTLTLGGVDGPVSVVGTGGYDQGVQSCFDTWHAANPDPIPGQTMYVAGEKPSIYIEEQGPVSGWCQAVELFATAARMAGPDLNRRTFVEAMSRIQNFPGTWSPLLDYGPDRYAGPSQYQVVELHNNQPPSSLCDLTWQHLVQGTCWVVEQSWKPLLSGAVSSSNGGSSSGG